MLKRIPLSLSSCSILILCTVLWFFTCHTAWAQMSDAERERLNQLNWEDHQLMLEKLGITELRPGPSGDPNASNAANTDETKANPFTTLPDPLIFDDGSPVSSCKQWVERRREIVEAFDREVYGRAPQHTPLVRWQVTSEQEAKVGEYPVVERELEGRVDNRSFPSITVTLEMSLTLPSDRDGPVPIVLEFSWGKRFAGLFKEPVPSWKEWVLAKGWGYALLVPTSYQEDHAAGLKTGIIGLMNQGRSRDLDDWGALRAWAWGASRAMDYFETMPDVDASRVVIEGLSRYGKAALVTMAYDERFAIGLIGSSGAGGAKILRRVFGEQVENLASSWAHHWFAPNFIKYAGPLTANDLPVDAHELIALCAPRPVFISVGSPDVEGQWVDARGMFLAAVHAGPVYELLGKTSLETDAFPELGTALVSGDVAFRQHEGGHTVYPNWPTFLEWADRYFTRAYCPANGNTGENH